MKISQERHHGASINWAGLPTFSILVGLLFWVSSASMAVQLPASLATRHNLASEVRIENIDFRRTAADGGTLIVDLSEVEVSIDTHQQDGEITVDLFGVTLPIELERRLDVVDFATPVHTIDAFQKSDNVRLVLVPQGQYRHRALHSGKRFTLIVDPVEVTEAGKKNVTEKALGFDGDRLSISFQKIEVRAALAVIADFTGINFVTSDSVQGDITINLNEVPWDQALDIIMKTKGLAKRQTGNVIWVAPSAEIAQFEEDQLKANAIERDFAPLKSEIIQINYAKAAAIADVIKSVKVVKQGSSSSNSGIAGKSGTFFNATETDKNSLLTERGSVTVDKRTNSLLVQDVASKIRELRAVIAKLDKPVRQVLIETRIVEASDTFSRELGARLGFQRLTNDAQFPGRTGSNIGDVFASGTTEGSTSLLNSYYDGQNNDGVGRLEFIDQRRGQPGGLAIDLGANGIGENRPASYAFDIFRAGRGFAHLITLELSALEADGRGKVVASPRLVTANQKQAVIKQGEERVFTVTGNNNVEIETKEAVLALEVTPQITPDDRIVLDVRITQDTFIPTPDSSGRVAAALRKKEIVTQVLADNGETIVIGGIYQEENAQGKTQVPILGNIPIIGNLFKKRTKRDNRTELLIF